LAEETLHHVVASLMTILRVHGEAGEHDILKIGIVVALQALVVEAEKSAQWEIEMAHGSTCIARPNR